MVNINGFADVYFQKGRGEPSGTLTITLSSLGEQKTVTVNAEGAIDVQ